MQFQKRIAVLGLLLITLASQMQESAASSIPVDSLNDTNLLKKNSQKLSPLTKEQKDNMLNVGIHGIVPTASMDFFLMPKPIGPLLGAVAALFEIGHTVYEAYKTPVNSGGLSTLMDGFWGIEKKIATNGQTIIDRVSHTLQAEKVQKMKRELEEINDAYYKNINYLLDTTDISEKRETLIENMMDNFSPFYQKLVTFNIKYILTSNTALSEHFKEKSFFDLVLERFRFRTMDNLNCGHQSDQTKVLRAYIYMTGILSRGYQLVIAGHMAQYHEYQKLGQFDEAMTVLTEAMDVMDKFIERLNPIIMDTEWAIEESSRDIRPCDSSEPKLNETYMRFSNFARVKLGLGQYGLSYIHNPKAWYLQPVSLRLCNVSDLGEPSIFHKDNNNSCEPEEIHGQITLYTDPKDDERVYSYIKTSPSIEWIKNGETPKIYGKTDQKQSHRIELDRREKDICSVKICKLFDDGGRIKFSTKAVYAQEGYVVTGIRWVILDNVVYIQIQEGKFMNIIEVDPETVHWQNVSKNDDGKNLLTLTGTQRSVILDDSILQARSYVTGFRLILLDGMMSLIVMGLKANKPGDQLKIPTPSTAFRSHLLPMKELKLNDADIPERAPKNQKNSVVGKPGEYYVKFQHSSLDADAGQTTIPYLDIQPVVTQPPAPIGGIGIYLKRIEGFGGFLGLKLLSPNFQQMVDKDKFEKYYEKVRQNFREITADTQYLPDN